MAAVAMLPTSLAATNATDQAAVARNLDTFNTLFKEIATYYVDSIDADRSMRIAIDAMLGDLDPYTEYMPASEQDDILTLTTGYGGIGSVIMQVGDSVEEGDVICTLDTSELEESIQKLQESLADAKATATGSVHPIAGITSRWINLIICSFSILFIS